MIFVIKGVILLIERSDCLRLAQSRPIFKLLVERRWLLFQIDLLPLATLSDLFII